MIEKEARVRKHEFFNEHRRAIELKEEVRKLEEELARDNEEEKSQQEEEKKDENLPIYQSVCLNNNQDALKH